MAFLATNPINIIIPKIVNIFKVSFVKANNNKAPMNDNGIENKMMNGLEKLSYKITITAYTKTTEANKAIPNVPKPSSCFLCFHPIHKQHQVLILIVKILLPIPRLMFLLVYLQPELVRIPMVIYHDALIKLVLNHS